MFKIIFIIPLLLLACSKKQAQVAEQTEEIETVETEKPRVYGNDLCSDHVKNRDTIGYNLCCEENNACWHEEDSLVRIRFPRLIPGKDVLKCTKTYETIKYWQEHCKPKGIDMFDCPCLVD